MDTSTHLLWILDKVHGVGQSQGVGWIQLHRVRKENEIHLCSNKGE